METWELLAGLWVVAGLVIVCGVGAVKHRACWTPHRTRGRLWRMVGLGVLLLGGCSFPLPIRPAIPPDGALAVGRRHWVAMTNVSGVVVFEDFHPPCLVGTNCGRGWTTMNFGPGSSMPNTFALSDVRLYYDAPSDRILGVSIGGDLAHVGVFVSLPDGQSWGTDFPSAALTYGIAVNPSSSDNPRLGSATLGCCSPRRDQACSSTVTRPGSSRARRRVSSSGCRTRRRGRGCPRTR